MTSWGDTLRPPLEIAPAARERSGARPTEVPVDRTNGTSGRRLLPRIDRRASPAGLFLGAQERVCRKRATEAGYEVAPSHVYSIVLSGARRDRPDYQRMLADAAAGDFKALFVWKFDRLGRDAEELLRARRMLEAAGVRLVSVTEGEPQAILRYGFEAIIAQDAREKSVSAPGSDSAKSPAPVASQAGSLRSATAPRASSRTAAWSSSQARPS
jgi:hypothetical protein